MKRFKGLLVLLAVLALTICCIAGCGEEKENETAGSSEPEVHTIVDMAGREVTVPVQIDQAFPTSPVGTVMLYTMDPELLIGWNNELRQGKNKYIPSKYQDLPHLGGWYGKATCNTEELLKIKPDVIFSIGTINQMAVSQADKIQQQVDIPVIVISSDLDKMDKSYELLGKVLNREDRADELGTYCSEAFKDVQAKAKNITEGQQLKVYYAEGPEGLETEPKGGHTKVLDIVGGINVADVPMQGGYGRTPVSLEQILSWNPDVIISWNKGQGGYYEKILSDPRWKGISAVQEKRVYAVPGGPFNWFDRPPSVNRILGLKWLGNLLYPDVYKYDMSKETCEFYKKFYHYDLSPEEIDSLLKDCGGK